MSWATALTQGTRDFLTLSDAYNKSKMVRAMSKVDETLSRIEEAQLRRAATFTENEGVKRAQIEHYKGRKLQSDATAQMAASGGVVDPEMLARIKMRSDYNAMSAVFEARIKAIDLRQQAGMTRIGAAWRRSEAKREESRIRRDAITGVVMNAMSMVPASNGQKTNTYGGYTGSSQRMNQSRGMSGNPYQ